MKRKRRAMGEDPLDSIVPMRRPDPEPSAEPKVRTTILLPPELIEAVRDAVVHLSGPPLFLTLTDLATGALRAELDRLAQQHNRGEPFPPRASSLRTRTLR